jgi:hypothetical protein
VQKRALRSPVLRLVLMLLTQMKEAPSRLTEAGLSDPKGRFFRLAPPPSPSPQRRRRAGAGEHILAEDAHQQLRPRDARWVRGAAGLGGGLTGRRSFGHSGRGVLGPRRRGGAGRYTRERVFLGQGRDHLTAPQRGGREDAMVADEVGAWRRDKCGEAAQEFGGVAAAMSRARRRAAA